MYYIYVLLCSDNSLYTGISNNPDQRYRDHLNGKGGRYTRVHRPIKRVYLEEIGTRSDALKREAEIKRWTRERKIREFGLKPNIG
jgi:putative endonuclease